MLIKINKQTTVEETHEVNLPFFSLEDRFGLKHYFAIHENVSFSVMISDHVVNVSIVNDPDKIYDAIKHPPITEMDFDFAYQMAIDRLRKSFIPVTEKEIV